MRAAPAPVQPADPTRPVPLTPAQRGLFFAEQRLGDAAAYAVAERTRLAGPLDLAAWRRAADALLAATPALRMRLVTPGAEPEAESLVPDAAGQGERSGAGRVPGDDVLPHVRFDAPAARSEVIDLRTEVDPAAAADAWIERALRQPVDTSRGVVSHAVLLLTGEREASWFLRIHHLAADGYGFALLGRDLAKRYSQELRGGAGGVTPAGVAADGTAVEGAAVDGADTDVTEVDGAALSGLLAVTREQEDFAGSEQGLAEREYWAARAPEHACEPLVGPSGSVQPLRETVPAPPRRLTAPSLLAALALLGSAVGEREQSVVGVHVMNRRSTAALRSVCTAQSVLAVPVDLERTQTIGALLRHVEQEWEGARAHQGYRHEELRRDRGLAPEAPAWDVELNLVPFAQSAKYGEASGRAEPVWDGPAEGLCLDVRAGAGGHDELVLQAPEGAIAPHALRGMARALGRIAAALAAAQEDPEAPEAALPLEQLDLADPEPAPTATAAVARTDLAEDRLWALGALDRSDDVTRSDDATRSADVTRSAGVTRRDEADPSAGVSSRDEAVRSADVTGAPHGAHAASGTVPATAGAPARGTAADLVASDRSLTRPETAAEVNRLARLLRAAGVGAGDRVLVHLPRDSWGILAPLAVLATGAAWVPCDTDWPPARVQAVLAAAAPRCVLSTEPDAFPGATVIDPHAADTRAALDALSPAPLGDDERARPVQPDDAAYVLFTSGSTGVPKGVVVAHRNLANFARTLRELYLPQELAAAGLQVGGQLTVVHEHSLAFDSGLSPLVSFLAGHRLLLPTQDQLRIPSRHLAFLREHVPDVMDVSPAVLEELLAHGLRLGQEADGRLLTSVLIGGDAASSGLWATLRRATERGVFAANAYGPTENTVDATIAWVAEHDAPSIGRQLPRQRADVVDAWGRTLPSGMSGELVLSGASVTQGYLGDPERTAERFSLRDGGPAYRTGDLVRREADGSLSYLGRADQQLSLRGVRIEAGEVEAALSRLSGVRAAVVVIRDDGAGERLIGYVLRSADGLEPALEDGLARLREQLPASFVPSALVALDELPLTDRGKVDRTRLPAPALVLGHGATWERMSQEERLVATVYAEVLGVERESLRSGSELFGLGGHSLTAARVVGRLAEAGYASLRLADVFSHPAVGELAAVLATSETEPVAHGSVPGEALPDAGGATRADSGASSVSPAGDADDAGGALVRLTDAQRRLWFIGQAEGPSALYSIPVLLPLPGQVDPRALTEALVDTVTAHPTLGHVYPQAEDGSPLPIPMDAAAIRAAVTPRPARLPERSDATADQALGADVDAVIDPSTELPLRVYVDSDPERGRDTVVLLLHHLAADGASLPVLLQTLSVAYAARADGRDPGLPVARPLPEPGAPGQEEIEWWRRYLSGLPETIELPLDRERPALRDHRGAAVLQRLDAETSAGVQRLATEHSATAFMVLRAALAAVLTRCGAGEDVPLGTISSNRATAAQERAVTFLANTLATRTDTSGDPRLGELVDRVRASTLEELGHAEVPFDAVVGAVNPPRSPRHHPLFQVMLVGQTTPEAHFAANDGGLATRATVTGTGTSKFDLTLEVDFDQDGIGLRWEYAQDVFDRSTVQTLAGWFEDLLARAVSEPESRLWAVPLSAAAVEAAHAEARRMLESQRMFESQGQQPAPSEPVAGAPTLAQALEDALARFADSTALTQIGEDGAATPISYAQLDVASVRVRDAVVAAGVGTGELVAALVPRSAAQVATLIGILRAGAAYVPLDPDSPQARLAIIVEDARPAALVCHGVQPSDEVRSALGAAPLLQVRADPTDSAPDPATPDSVASATDPADPAARRRAPEPSDPAYVIFTSGSTGRPKGVQVPQSNVLRLLSSTAHWFGFGPQDVFTLFHSCAFDFAVWEMYGALLHGGRLVVVPTALSRSPGDFLSLLQREEVTVLNQTPSAFGQLVRADAERGGAELPALRCVVLGGEAMDPAAVQAWFRHHPPGTPELVNMYGITETTVHVTYQALAEELSSASPVGEPIPDLAVYLLDAGGHPVPDGVVGEIHVGGAGVAAGYVNRPELTAQRFLPDPYVAAVAPASAAPGTEAASGPARMYRSGDLAVRRHGVLHFRGRADRQVQLRGFRVELGEVEAAAREVESVQYAHARVVHVGEGDDRLVVDLVGPDPATADPVQLRRDIAAGLPAQMAPAAVTVLAEVPLTVNGKLDEAALPAPTMASSRGRAPETPTEELVCEAFAELLGLERCSAQDSFFDLGGHSLLAVTLVARLRAATGAPLRVGTLLGAPTPEALAAHLDGHAVLEEDAELRVVLPLRGAAAAQERPGPGSVFCLHPAGGLSWCYAGLPRHLPEQVPVWGLQARGVLDPTAQPGSLADMAEDYIAEMLRVSPEGPYHLVGWSLGGMVAHVMAARMQARGLEVGTVALLDAYPSEAERGVEEPPLQDALSAVLAMAGLEDDELEGREVSVDTLTEILAARRSPMAGLPPQVLAALVRTYRNTARILREYRHESYTGDVLFFRATRAGIGPDHDPHEWDRYVDSPLRIIDVDCTHREMTRPGPLAGIGEVIAAELGAAHLTR